MATSNEISIKLGLEGASAVNSQLRNLVGTAFSPLKNIVAGLTVGAAFTGLVRGIKEAVNTADDMGKLAQKTGIAVEALSALSYAAKLNEVDTHQLAFAIRFLSKEMVKSGQGAASVEEEFLKLADRFKAMPDGARKTALAIDQFGRSGMEMIPMLNQGSAAIRLAMEEARALGLVITDKTARAADEFNDNLQRLKASATGAALTIVTELVPAMDALGMSMNRGASFLADGANALARWIPLSREMRALAGAGAKTGFGAYGLGQLAAMAQQSLVLKQLFAVPVEAGLRGAAALLGTGRKPADEGDPAQEYKDAQDVLKLEVERTRLINDRVKLRGQEIAGLDLLQTEERHLNVMRQLASDAIEAGTLTEYEGKKQLLEIDKELLAIESKRIAKLHEGQRQTQQMNQMLLQGASNMFGSFASLAQSFGRKGFAAWKGLAIAQAIINTFTGATGAFSAMASIPGAGPGLGAAAAAMAIAAGMANVAQIASTQPSGFALGGFTGAGGRMEPAGLVHRGEYVFSAPSVERIGLPTLEAMDAGGARQAINVAVFDDRSGMRNWLQSEEGKSVVVEIMAKNRHRIV